MKDAGMASAARASMEKIFVQIASYRDPECQWTVKDLYEKAVHPERIFVGICWQYDENEDMHCFDVPYAHPAQVRAITFHTREAEGSGWAHMQAQSLWNGEEYVLQIHAHMRFEQGWDELLISTLARCPSDKPALSTCLPAYTPPDNFPFRHETRASFVMVIEVNPDSPQLITLQGALVDRNEAMAGPTHNPFWAGTFLFAKAALMQEVPFDPHIQYYGEPLAYSARLFTHGWDLFEPDQLILYHWWGREFKLPRPYRETGTERQRHSFMRLKHLLRLAASPESAALTGIERYGLGHIRSIEDFWQFSGVHPATGKCTELARRGRWNESWADYIKEKEKPQPPRPRIFVQIASYRDPECQWTVKDLFEKAKDPDRIFVGICWQHDPEEDQNYFKVSTRPGQVRTALFHWKESQGVCWARHQTQLLWEGEEYTLMIDSHMRFEFDWDQKLIDDLALCPSPKAVLSNYPAGFMPPHTLEAGAKPTIQRPHPYEDGDIRFRGDNLDRFPEKPLRGAFIAAGLLFARSEVIREVPYDPYLYFNQEELSLAARLYTHGWDVYSMRQVLVYHLYVTDTAQNKRPLHWQENAKWAQMQERARKRMDHLMGYAPSDDPTVTRDLMKYGLGFERTLEEFSAFCGIDFKRREISDWALRCGFIEDLHKYKNDRIFIPEVDGVPAPQGPVLDTSRVMSFPDPEQGSKQSFDVMLLANNTQRKLALNTGAPKGIFVIRDYLEPPVFEALLHHVQNNSGIGGMAAGILNIFNDIFCHRLAPFYDTDFEWYERPQILAAPHGNATDPRCDAEQWDAGKKAWVRIRDRDYSVLLCLKGGAEAAGLHFADQNYTLNPTAGMLIAFPSDHRYLHMFKPGACHMLTSWGTAGGSPRILPHMPVGAVFLGQKRF
jgi:hypothetical protein